MRHSLRWLAPPGRRRCGRRARVFPARRRGACPWEGLQERRPILRLQAVHRERSERFHAEDEAALVEEEARAVVRDGALQVRLGRDAAEADEQARGGLLEEGEVLGAAGLVD